MLTIKGRQILLQCCKKELGHTTPGLMTVERLSSRRKPAYLVAYSHCSSYCTSFPSHQSLAFQVTNPRLSLGCVSGSPTSQLPQLFGPCCPSQCCLLDHRLNQEPIPSSPVLTWLIQSCQTLWRARQDESQAWWWCSIPYWPLIGVVCCRNKMSYLAWRCSCERQ